MAPTLALGRQATNSGSTGDGCADECIKECSGPSAARPDSPASCAASQHLMQEAAVPQHAGMQQQDSSPATMLTTSTNPQRPTALPLTSIRQSHLLEVGGLSQHTDRLHQHILDHHAHVTATEPLRPATQFLEVSLCRHARVYAQCMLSMYPVDGVRNPVLLESQ
jgi:hypothetical protein